MSFSMNDVFSQVPWWSQIVILALYIEAGIILGVHWFWLVGYDHGQSHKNSSFAGKFVCFECDVDDDISVFVRVVAFFIMFGSFLLWPLGIAFRVIYMAYNWIWAAIQWACRHLPSPMAYFKMLHKAFDNGQKAAEGETIESQGTRTDAP